MQAVDWFHPAPLILVVATDDFASRPSSHVNLPFEKLGPTLR